MRDPADFPKLVTVGEEEYHVVFFTKLTNDDAGFCDFDGKIIGISRHQPEEDLLATFFHEFLHACEHELGCPIGHPKIRKLEFALARAAAELFLRNPTKK